MKINNLQLNLNTSIASTDNAKIVCIREVNEELISELFRYASRHDENLRIEITINLETKETSSQERMEKLFIECNNMNCDESKISYLELFLTANNNPLWNNISKLTKREVELGILYVSPFSYSQVANKMFITSNTVKDHIKHIYGKLNIHTKKGLTKYFTDNKVLFKYFFR